MVSSQRNSSESGQLAEPGHDPAVSDLIQEFRRTLADGEWAGRNATNEDTRFCYWSAQSDDGKKHDSKLDLGKKAFPWDGASDVRTFLAETVCAENADQKYAAFWRAAVRMQGIGPEDIPGAAQGTKFMDWLVRGPLRCQLDTEAELSAQYDETHGWYGLHVTWDRKVGQKLVEVTLENLLRLAQSAPQLAQRDPALAEVAGSLPMLLADPSLESEAVKAVQYLHDVYVRNSLPEDLTEDDVLMLSAKRARQAVRDLRTTGTTELPVPYLCRNLPCITALKPYRDILFPHETGDIQDAAVIFIRHFVTESQLRGMALTEKLDPDWVDEALKTRGKYSVWSPNPYGLEGGGFEYRTQDGKSWLIELVTAYYKQTDEDGVVSVKFCLFCPHVERTPAGAELVGQRGTLATHNDRYPIFIGRVQRADRNISQTRGTAELLSTIQNVEKSQWDSIVDLTSLAVVPPLNIPKGVMGQQYKFGPAVQNEYVPGREAKFLEVPKQGAPLAFGTLEALDRKVDRWFGRFAESVPPAISQLKLETRITRFLVVWGEALNHAFVLTCREAPELVQRVTGTPAPDPANIAFDYALHFDAAQLNPDLMVQKLDAYSKLLPEDAAGVIDRAKFIALKASLIDPEMARQLLNDQAGASLKMQMEVRDDLASIITGMPATIRDAADDPTAPFRIQAAQQYVQANPALAQLAQQPKQDPRGEQLVKYLKNLEMGAMQQQNKTVGRLGVQP